MPRQAESSRAQPTVMVVEDEFVQREEMLAVLSRQGLRVVSAENGFAAMHQIRRSRPAVIVLDINLPGIDGFQVARLIETLDYKPKVILVSGYPRELLRAHQEDLGVFAIVEKPIPFPALTRFIREALGGEIDGTALADEF